MPWWGDVLFLMAVAIAIWGFISLTRFSWRILTRESYRTAENLYANFAGSAAEQRRYAREHGDEWRNADKPSGGPGDTS